MVKQAIHTGDAPEAIGTYSQAIKVGQTIFISGQIPLEPGTMKLVDEDIRAQTHRVFSNLSAVARMSRSVSEPNKRVIICPQGWSVGLPPAEQ